MWSQRGAFLSQAKYSLLPPIGAPASRYINQRLSESRPAARHPRQTYPHVPAQPMAPSPSGRGRHGRHRITSHPRGALSTASTHRPSSLHPARACHKLGALRAQQQDASFFSIIFNRLALEFQDFFGYVHTVLHSGCTMRSYVRLGCKGSRGTPQARASRCWSRKPLSDTAQS